MRSRREEKKRSPQRRKRRGFRASRRPECRPAAFARNSRWIQQRRSRRTQTHAQPQHADSLGSPDMHTLSPYSPAWAQNGLPAGTRHSALHRGAENPTRLADIEDRVDTPPPAHCTDGLRGPWRARPPQTAPRLPRFATYNRHLFCPIIDETININLSSLIPIISHIQYIRNIIGVNTNSRDDSPVLVWSPSRPRALGAAARFGRSFNVAELALWESNGVPSRPSRQITLL